MIQKKFNKSFDDALTQAYLFQTNFLANKTDFITFLSVFADPFGADFLDLITAADDFPTFEDDQNETAIYTLQVEETMENARNIFKKLTFCIDIAWPNSEINQRAFRVNLYESCRKSPQKMINLLQNAHAKAVSVTFNADLIANGFNALDIALLDSIATELTQKYNAQQDFIQLTFERTENRTVAFNKFWDEMVKISNASKMIFKDSPAKIETFLLYPEGAGPGSLTAPTNLTFYFPTKTFSWDAVDNATSYQLQWSVDGDEANYVEIFSGTDTSFIYNEIASPINYLRVRARNNNGYSEFSEVLIQGYFAVLPPPLIVGVDLVPNTTNSVRVVWEEVPSATKYRVYRSTVNIGDPAGSWVLASQENGTSLIETVSEGKRYYYRLTAENAYQASVVSSNVFVDVDVAP